MTDSEKKPLLSSSEEEEEELTGCGATVCCNPRRTLHRYLILIIMCFLSFGKKILFLILIGTCTCTRLHCMIFDHTCPLLVNSLLQLQSASKCCKKLPCGSMGIFCNDGRPSSNLIISTLNNWSKSNSLALASLYMPCQLHKTSPSIC